MTKKLIFCTTLLKKKKINPIVVFIPFQLSIQNKIRSLYRSNNLLSLQEERAKRISITLLPGNNTVSISEGYYFNARQRAHQRRKR